MENLALVRAYISAVEAGATGDELARFFAPEVVQTEYPNLLLPATATRDLAAILEGAQRGQQVVEDQHFEITREYECGVTVIIEVEWRATLKMTVGKWHVGHKLSAHIAMFIEVKAGKIVAQRNYDCYPAT